MKITIIGFVSGFGIVAAAIFLKEERAFYLNLTAILVVVGGTISAVCIYFSYDALRYAMRSFTEIFYQNTMSPKKLITVLMEVSRESRHVDFIEVLGFNSVKKIPFLEKGLTLIADNVEEPQIRRIMNQYSQSLTRENRIAERVFGIAGSFAPMFGMMGTVIGLIAMLHRVDDPSSIPAAMGLALVTTLYGLMLSALIFTPISGKIRDRNHFNTRLREIIIEGILAIKRGENTQIIKEKLDGFVG